MNAIQAGQSCNTLDSNDLQTPQNPVTPNVTPEIEKGVILDALKGMDRADLLALLNAALVGKDSGE